MTLALAIVSAVALAEFAQITIMLSDRRKERRMYVNRENDLLNRLAHATGNTWLPPSVEEPDVPVRVPDYIPLPEQEEE